MAQKAQENVSMTQLEIQSLFTFSFNHVERLPQENIQEVVILVSIHDGMEYVFQQITEKKITKQQLLKPFCHKLDKDLQIIYPTKAFINPEVKHYFVSMHYLLNTVKRAKFIFIFKHPDMTQKPIKNVKQTMMRFASLFPYSHPQQLGSSCGYIIYQPKLREKPYFNIFSDMYIEDSKYVEDNIKRICKTSMTLDNIVLFSSDDKINKKELLTTLVKKLKYFQLPKVVQPTLVSVQTNFINSKIDQRWSGIFKKMYQRLDDLINQCKQLDNRQKIYPVKQNKPKRLEQELSQWPQKVIDKQYYQKQWPLKIDFSHKAYRLCSFLSSYLSILSSEQFLQQKNNQQITCKFMKSLFDYGYLNRYSIYLYFVDYFKFYKFYPKNGERSKMVLQPVQFNRILGNLQTVHQKMTIFINQIYDFLEQEIPFANVGYPFVEIINQLTKIHELLANWVYKFATNRTFKKLLKYRAQLAFRRATVVTNAYNIPKSQIIEAWLSFLRYVLQSSLIQSSKIQGALNFFAEELIKNKQFQLALKVYLILPEYKSYRKIISIYQRNYKFNIEILKYSLSFNWQNKKGPFQDYCKFLIRIGFYQKVRQLCLEGLKVIEDDQDGSQILKEILTNARGDQSRDIHIQFLQNLNGEEKQIKIDKQLLEALQRQFKENKER